MNRRAFIAIVDGGILAVPLAVEAQQGGKAVRIRLLDFASPDPARVTWWTAFRERLRELGYVEGQNIAFEPRWGNGNVSGLPSLAGKVPEAIRRVGADHLQAAEAAARAMGLSVSMSGVEREGDFENAFASAKRARAQAVLQLGSTSFIVRRHALVDSATKARLPVACEEREFVLIGCLLAHGPSYRDNTRRAAAYVDRILKGSKASDLPIEQPTKFELMINLKTARALGLTIPPSVLGRADQVIE